MSYQNPPNLCPVCQEKAEFKFVQDYKNEEGEWSLYEYSECQVQFWMPFKNPGGDWYENEYDGYLTRDIGKPRVPRELKPFLTNFKNCSKDIRVLDLGCGTGDVIAELQKKGCEVWGVDFNKNAIKFIEKCFKLKNVYAMSFDEFFKLPNLPKFDVVTFFGVIEHLNNPLEFIQNVSRILKKNGTVVLHTPSRERMWDNSATLPTKDFPPQHLTRWNEKAISNLFKKINFEIINIYYIGQFKGIFDSLAGKFSFGLVAKSMKISKNKENNNKENADIRIGPLTKIVHLGAHFKDYLLFGIPALILFLISKVTRYKNENGGHMLIWLKR